RPESVDFYAPHQLVERLHSLSHVLWVRGNISQPFLVSCPHHEIRQTGLLTHSSQWNLLSPRQNSMQVHAKKRLRQHVRCASTLRECFPRQVSSPLYGQNERGEGLWFSWSR